jgi:hypothetical protein
VQRLIALAALLASAAQAAPVGQGLRIDPVVVYFKLPPGASANQEFVIGNTGAQTLHFNITRRDAWHDAEGARIFPDPGGSPQGLANWLSLPKTTRLRVPPGGEVRFEGQVTVPPNTKPRTYLGGYVLTLVPSDAPEGKDAAPDKTEAGAKMISAIVLLVHVDVREPLALPPTASLEIVDQHIDAPQGARPLSVRLRLLNHGEYEVKAVGTLAIFDGTGKLAAKASFSPIPLWPLQQSWYEAQYAERLPPGTYTGLAAFSLEDPSGSGEAYSAPPLQRKVQFTVEAPTLKPPERPTALPAPAPKKKGAGKKSRR